MRTEREQWKDERLLFMAPSLLIDCPQPLLNNLSQPNGNC